ncbi:MAG: hypothetical protein JWL59_1389 [Chthoniobacteraceae bacterium]|nr:hypothetical protein [Chthoniobacteraceae bacterium]
MKDLYARLEKAGFERSFVVDNCLPDWWDDELAEIPANRSIAEIAISRHFGCDIADLRDSSKELRLRDLSPARMKQNSNVLLKDVAPGRFVAERTIALLTKYIHSTQSFTGYKDANQVRDSILKSTPRVTLEALLKWCWENGVIVVKLGRFPNGSKKFDGMAMFYDDRPVIILGSARKSPAWLVFHLAHELGHIMHGHVRAGEKSIVDGEIATSGSDPCEQEADAFATKLLTGQPSVSNLITQKSASDLASFAWAVGERLAISPGVVALFYAHSRGQKSWGTANQALALLDEHEGAHELISAALDAHIDYEDMPESTARFLSVLH